MAPDPRQDPTGFVERCSRATEEEAISCVIPGTEAALVALATHRELLPRGVVGVPERGVVELATDKTLLPALAARAGLLVPQTVVLDRADLGDELEFTYPLVVKPLRSEISNENGRMVHSSAARVTNERELADAVSLLPDRRVIVQPFLSGSLYSVCGVSWNGELFCSLHQVSKRIWPSDCGMASYGESVRPDRALDERLSTFLSSVGWSGIFQVQFLACEGGLLLIDFNPRLYHSLGLAVRAGLNLPAIWTDLLLGRTPTIGSYQVGIRWRWEEGDPRALIDALRRGDWRTAAAGLIPRAKTTHAIFSIHDPRPLLTSVERLLARARSG